MPVATLTFNLPEESPQHSLACNAETLALSLNTIKQILRQFDKSSHTLKDYKNCLSSIELELLDLNLPLLEL
jgi:hypothetical protein